MTHALRIVCSVHGAWIAFIEDHRGRLRWNDRRGATWFDEVAFEIGEPSMHGRCRRCNATHFIPVARVEEAIRRCEPVLRSEPYRDWSWSGTPEQWAERHDAG